MTDIKEATEKLVDALIRSHRMSHTSVVAASASILDTDLERCIKLRLRPLNRAMTRRLFGTYCPLSTFNAKIDMAYALDITTDAIHVELNKIRKIRNLFAHSTSILSLDKEPIRPLLILWRGRQKPRALQRGLCGLHHLFGRFPRKVFDTDGRHGWSIGKKYSQTNNCPLVNFRERDCHTAKARSFLLAHERRSRSQSSRMFIDLPQTTRTASFHPAQQPRQLGEVRRNAPGLIARQQVSRRAAAGLLLVVDIRERLAILILDDEAGGVCLIDGPWRRETACG